MSLIQFKINKMLNANVRLSIIFLTISTMVKAEVTELLDLPLMISDGVLDVTAKLYAYPETYSVKELALAYESAITGKIVVSNDRESNDKDSYDIHYQFDRSGNDSKERLVIHGNDCSLYNHSKMTQNANLFGTNKPLSDLILLMGPSIIYRLAGQSTVWSEATQKGSNLKRVTTTVNETLAITLYYTDKFDTHHGVKNPIWIKFDGYETASYPPGVNKLTLAIEKNKFETIELYEPEDTFYPSFGIGCPNYLSKSERKSIPKLLTKYVNFIMYETIQGSTYTNSEITASGKSLLMSIETPLSGVKTDVIYDNGLGIIFTLKDGRCQMTIGDKNSPGRDAKGYFKLENLFFVDGDFNYIGKDFSTSEFPDVWESVQFNVDFEGNKVDKFVVTQYFIESPDSTIFNGYRLLQTMISIYNLDSSQRSYVLAKRIEREYVNVKTVETEHELYDSFMLKDCKYLLNERKVTLNFKIVCEALNTDCIKLANRRLVQFKEEFIDAMLLYKPISPLRVDDIQYRSTDSHISMRVTFLDKPNFDDLMKPEKMIVSNETFDVARTLFANNERECLDQLGHVRGLFSVGIWRSSDSFCGYLRKFEDFKEDAKNGESCDVYILPLEKYFHISHELELDDLQKSFLKDKFRTFSMKDPDSHKSVSYKLIDIVKVPEFEKDDKVSDINSFYTIAGNSKLKKDDKTTLVVPEVSTFAECLRVCQNSEKLECNSFSFCSDSHSVDCRVSALRESNFTDTANIETDSKCSIFTVNALRYYSKVLKRKFKTQISLESSLSATSCAQKCLSSRDCISFQQCGYFCSFNGFYTDESTAYDEECVIYYPKVSHGFRSTGNEIVPEVIHTEMNLELGQCALLCHGLSYGDNGCKSFNYCPKNIDRMESSCSLTKYSVKNSNTNITEGGHCSNYSLASFPFFKNYKKSNEVQVSHEYRYTGNKIVSEVIHTEMNLNLDQCASLCYVISHGDFGCISFNYCPRNVNQIESSCSLTRYSVKSPDTNSTEEAHCSNYELITRPSRKTNEESSEMKLIKGTNGSSAFGIIMMFLVIVSLLVFSAPCVYEKIKPKRVFAQLNESLTWTKQVNEQPGTTKINMSDF